MQYLELTQKEYLGILFTKDQINVITTDARCCLAKGVAGLSNLMKAGEPSVDARVVTGQIAYAYVNALERYVNEPECLTELQINDIIEDLGKILCKCYTEENVNVNYSFILTESGGVLTSEAGEPLIFTPINGLTFIEI